jgi:hypothetical protein
MNTVAPVKNTLEPKPSLLRRQNVSGGSGRAAAQTRARLAAQIKQSAPAGLQPLLAPLSAAELTRLRQGVCTTPELSLAQVLRLLPPLVAAKIMQARSKALLEMLLAWGKALRKQSMIARQAQKRAQQKAYEANRLRLGQQEKLQAAKARQMAIDGLEQAGLAWPVAPSPLAAARGLVLTGFNQPTLEALAQPLVAGISLRGPILRLRAHG